MRKTGLLLLFTCICIMAKSQKTFSTQEGHILCFGSYTGNQFIAESHRLLITFNTDYKQLMGSIALNTMVTGIPDIDSLINKTSTQIKFEGEVPIDFLTWNHPDVILEVPLKIMMNGSTFTEVMKVTFKHVGNLNNITCLLSGSLEIDLAKYSPILLELGIKSGVKIFLTQLVLRKT